MRRLAVWTLILFVITSALTAGTMAYGRSRPDDNPLKALGFGVCESKPCFMGITPGITSWGEITRQLKVDNDNRFYLSNVYPNNILVPSDDKSGIREISIFTNDGKGLPSIRYFVQLYGTPCAVATDRTHPQSPVTIDYPTVLLIVYLPDNRLNANLPVDSVSINAPSRDEASDLCKHEQDLPVAPWLGFTTLDRYESTN